MSARRSPDALWSASFSIQVRRPGSKLTAERSLVGSSDDELRNRLWGAARIQFVWRYAGKTGTESFKLPAQMDDAVAFRRTLTLAIAADWPADERRHPIQPGGRPDPASSRPKVVPLPLGDSDARPDGPSGSVLPLPAAPPGAKVVERDLFSPRPADTWDDLSEKIVPLEDFVALCEWRMADLQRNTSKRGSRRAGSTLANVEGELAAAADFFRYLQGDERLDGSGIEVFSALRLNDRDAFGLSVEDCLAFVEHRKNLNLTTRSANYKAELRWVGEIEAGERDASRTGAPFVLPEPPRPAAEIATSRTVQATCSTVRAALADALAEGRIESSPWTGRVDRRIEQPAPTHFTEKQLFSANNVHALIEAIATSQRPGHHKGETYVESGERFRGPVALQYWAFLRPEEARAARLSWLHLNGPNPGIVVDGAEVNYPRRFTDATTTLTLVSLKQRNQGETRWVPIPLDLVDVLKTHIKQFVAVPDPTSEDVDSRDPRLFTGHDGAPVNLRSFAKNWFRPALDVAFADEPALRSLRFRHLRHSGITRELLAGSTIEDVATWAGNSPLVVKTSYRGAIERTGSAPLRARSQGASLVEDLRMLTPAEIEATAKAFVEGTQTECALMLGKAVTRAAKDRLAEEDD